MADIVCLPFDLSRESAEGMLIEAVACGCPIVTTDVPGCKEIVRHEENGLLVPVRDAVALAGAINRLVEDSALRQRMGRRGREIAVAEFSVERVVVETMVVYQELDEIRNRTESISRM